jgi:ribonuclease HI
MGIKNNINPGTLNCNTEHMIIYTDGSYDPTSGNASYALVLEEDGEQYNQYESEKIPEVQNNYCAELFAILRALINIQDEQSVTIHTDSQSSIDAINMYSQLHEEDKCKFCENNLLQAIINETT